MKRFWRYTLIGVGLYAVYLAALGPLYSVEARGFLNFIPEPVRRVIWIPALPLIQQEGVRRVFSGYLDWWYLDPNGVEPPLDW